VTTISERAADPDIAQNYDHLLAVISSKRFLTMQGLGNEVPFFICPFPPAEIVAMNRIQKQLGNTLAIKGVQVLEVNLYDLALELLKKRNIFDRVLATEKNVSKDQLLELLQGILDSENHLIPAIAEKMAAADFDVMFLTGVGEVFPYIRSHNVLNNLQSTAKDQPTVLFFPGSYTFTPGEGTSLDLFGRLRDDKYYRAFDIFNYNE
jgi:hypothetical protein